MSLYRPRKPSKPGALMSVWEMLFNGKFPFIDTPTVKWNKSTTGYSARAISSSGGGAGGGGWKWQTPNKELDSTVAVPGPSGDIYTAVYISPQSALVTAGMTDLVSLENVKATPGSWMALQPIPAAVDGKFNVPVIPPILAVPSGTPLKGDLDSTTAKALWIPICPYDYCQI